MTDEDQQATDTGQDSGDEAPPIEIDEALVNVEERDSGDHERKGEC
jgi:hypothetical protein